MEKNDKRPGAPKGVVDPAGAARRISLRQHAPARALAHCIEYFWIVEWDLRGQPTQTQRVLPYPNVHLAFEAGEATLHGVAVGPFEKTLQGQGRVLGVRLRPGGSRAFVGGDVAALTGRVLPSALWLEMPTDAARAVVHAADDAGMIAAAHELLAPRIAALAPDPRAALAERAVLAAQAERGPVSVAALSQAVDLDERALQRLFRTYVGVPPKWVIQRFRLQEAAARLAAPGPVDLALLAQELGFFDQAHLTRGFTSLVGRAPLEYWRSQQRGLVG
ncbi:helix-turn-helix domain-containing protein [Pseudoduganella chitinolytica]|uniref:Helix-turn-helix domain-containing protein n=1 Tax=Pseudoduganella chitinolytica TaxID=34070 RepID=A0ABY8BE33_9BURK|nr:helix-turn-helix domain-containing protein [Pseudoduganella chitinolytica]WEF33956.1 helix-turn-helix domain-containing protein [Pseudoduganella chitinolytica]